MSFITGQELQQILDKCNKNQLDGLMTFTENNILTFFVLKEQYFLASRVLANIVPCSYIIRVIKTKTELDMIIKKETDKILRQGLFKYL